MAPSDQYLTLSDIGFQYNGATLVEISSIFVMHDDCFLWTDIIIWLGLHLTLSVSLGKGNNSGELEFPVVCFLSYLKTIIIISKIESSFPITSEVQ